MSCPSITRIYRLLGHPEDIFSLHDDCHPLVHLTGLFVSSHRSLIVVRKVAAAHRYQAAP